MASTISQIVFVVYVGVLGSATLYITAMSAAYDNAMVSDLMHPDKRGTADVAGWEGATTITIVLTVQALLLLARLFLCWFYEASVANEWETPVVLSIPVIFSYITGATCTACSTMEAEACHATACSLTVIASIAYQISALYLFVGREWNALYLALTYALYAVISVPLLVMSLVPMEGVHGDRARRGAAIMQVITMWLTTIVEGYFAKFIVDLHERGNETRTQAGRNYVAPCLLTLKFP